MHLTPDDIIYFQWGSFKLNATLVFTWLVMAILVGGSYLITRNWSAKTAPSPWRNGLEMLVLLIEKQVKELSDKAVVPIVYFSGTLFLFIGLANLLAVVPGFRSPTGSLSTTLALTLAVLFAVPLFSFMHAEAGKAGYLRQLVQPSFILLPFNLLGEASKAISLAIRLYGNVMSGAVIVAILLGIAPFFFPVIMEMLGLITGIIQAYIFAILAAVYISAALETTPTSTPTKKS